MYIHTRACIYTHMHVYIASSVCVLCLNLHPTKLTNLLSFLPALSENIRRGCGSIPGGSVEGQSYQFEQRR